MTTRREAPLAIVLAAALAPAAWAASSEKVEELTWDVDLGTAVSVSSANGNVRVRRSDDGKLHVKATKQAKGKSTDEVTSALERVKIKVEKGKGRVTVSAEIPSNVKGGGLLSAIFGKDVAITVHYDVGLPERSDLEAESVNGAIDCLGIAGTITASNVNGSTTIGESGGPVSAKSVNGTVNVEIVAPLRAGEMSFSSVNGTILLELADGTGARLHVESVNGSLQSDFAMPLEKRLVGSELNGDIGGGGARIDIQTVNGSVHIGKLATKP